ncbi:hypothetical protein, partial [Sodaliphilus pleomorphus]|uniref:hypothetical protein n=1 Tax=Sodaliphilus pleomorphus TaxID=2606626 RepID=UPI001980DDA2
KNANGETFDFCYRLYSVYGFLTNQGQPVAVQLVALGVAERTRIFFRFRHSSVGLNINHLHSGFCALPSITRL